MDYSYYLKNNIPNTKKLLKYGFINNNQTFVFKKNLKQNGLYCVVQISADKIDVRVIDTEFNDDFIPFGIKNSQCAEKYEVECLLNDIIANCFDNVDVKTNLINYLAEKYQTIYQQPWKDYPNYYTFKTTYSKKWYAIIMNIKQSSIGLDGDNLIDIINVKIKPEKIPTLVDNIHYFKAYHMNKKNWVTIVLNKQTNLEQLKHLINESYNLTEKQKM